MSRQVVAQHRVNRWAVVWSGVAFGLAAVPFLLIGWVLAILSVPWNTLVLSGVVVFGLLAWPLVVQTNRMLVIAEVVSGGALGAACLGAGVLLVPPVGALALLPFLPAMGASFVAIAAAARAMIREDDWPDPSAQLRAGS